VPSILITGCSSGIGRRCAERCRDEGWRVFATARSPADVEILGKDGFETFALDLESSESILTAIAELKTRLGEKALDAVFHNGAYGMAGAIEDLSREALRTQFETNLFGTVELNNYLIPLFRKQGHGRIVLNSSVLGFVSLPFRGAYNASKYALEGIADTLRLELRNTGINISLIEPGPIESKFRENAYLAFQRHIEPRLSDPTRNGEGKSPHQGAYQSMIERLQKSGPVAPFTLPADAVADALLHAITHSRPRIRYRVTFPTRLFAVLKRILSARLLDRFLAKVGGDGSR
jgi:NAD(P)-dependent dehydrogenase (short-subunit alcohol dehydrogenase family)